MKSDNKDFYDTLSRSSVKHLRNAAFGCALLICVAFFVVISYVLEHRSQTAQALLNPLVSNTFPQARLRQVKIQSAVPLLTTQFGTRAPKPSSLQNPEPDMVTKTVEALAAVHALPHSSLLFVDSGCATNFAVFMMRHFVNNFMWLQGQRELVAVYSSYSIVETLLQEFPNSAVRIIEAAPTKLPLANDRFSTGFVFGCVRDHENLWATIAEMNRVLLGESQFVIILQDDDIIDTPRATEGAALGSSNTNPVQKHVAEEFKSALLTTMDANHFVIVQMEELTQYSISIIIATSPSTLPQVDSSAPARG